MPLNPGDWRFTVAPMLDWTDRHCRYFHRLLTSRARLYTEMVTTGAIIHGDRDRLLGFSNIDSYISAVFGTLKAGDKYGKALSDAFRSALKVPQVP